MDQISAFAFHGANKKGKKSSSKINYILNNQEKKRIFDEMNMMKKVLHQNGNGSGKAHKSGLSDVGSKRIKIKQAKRLKMKREDALNKVVAELKNFHNAGPKKTKESDKFSAEKIRESEKIVIANETLMSGIKNLIGSSKSESSVDLGRNVLSKLVQPLSVKKFLSTKYTKQHHVFTRNNQSFHNDVFSTKDLDTYIKDGKIWFGKNLDVTSYENGKRETHNPDGKASGPIVWTLYNDGCSLRLLNPQTFNDNVWMLCASLQEFFGSMVGANVYLTPPGTQGFAPHFDDVDVFIMQLEGKKRWKLYGPRNPSEILPRMSSPNFNQSEIGKPIEDVILLPGDMIYLPRGTIHQASCLPDQHSLHITVSCNQLNTYGDLLKSMIANTLETAMSKDVEFRETLPTDYLRLAGLAFKDDKSAGREKFLTKIKHLFEKLSNHVSVDGGVDQLGKRFMSDVLPPFLTQDERQRTVVESGFNWCNEKSKVIDDQPLPEDAYVRLIRGNCLRLVEEGGCFKLYHCMENSREYHEVEGSPWELPDNHVPVVQKLLLNYPKYISLEDFSLEELEAIDQLWGNSLLMAKNVFNGSSEERSQVPLKKK